MARLLVRTAFVNLRSRRLQTWLVALILAAASATLALAVSLRAGAADPYEKIARATNAADVHLFVHRGARADLAALAHARGVRAADGPFRIVGVSVRSRPSNVNLLVEGVGAQPRIDRPKVTEGRWLSGAKGEVVLDRTFARDGGFHLGQRLTIVGQHGDLDRPRDAR
jgi:putative ABC transport system permease protein